MQCHGHVPKPHGWGPAGFAARLPIMNPPISHGGELSGLADIACRFEHGLQR